MASSISSWYDVTGISSASDSKASPTANKDDASVEETFMSLLVAQIKNQNPLSPTDGVQFLSQLVEINELEQTMGIRDDLSAIYNSMPAAGAAGESKSA